MCLKHYDPNHMPDSKKRLNLYMKVIQKLIRQTTFQSYQLQSDERDKMIKIAKGHQRRWQIQPLPPPPLTTTTTSLDQGSMGLGKQPGANALKRTYY